MNLTRYNSTLRESRNSIPDILNVNETSPLLGQNKSSSVQVFEKGGHEKNQLGTFNGCYVPCMLVIMGLLLFLRLGWAVGQAGVVSTLALFAVAELTVFLTVLSLSALVTNGNMKGGGSYFMISRTLGPEMGGSIGVLFYASYAVSASFYVTGVGDELRNTMCPDTCSDWFVAGVASVALFFVLLVSLGGARYFTKINIWLCAFLSVSVLVGTFSIIFNSGVKMLDGSFSGWSWQRLMDNFSPAYTEDSDRCSGMCSFRKVFGVMYPAVTGIMEGANLSGDLKNPAYSIPLGTVSAVMSSTCIYFVLIFVYGGAFERETLQGDMTVMQEVAISWLIIAGILVSSLSAALGALFGGSRILQAMARDEIFPYTKIFAYGTEVGDEPRNAVIFTWIVAQTCCLVGNLDTIAQYISLFFLQAYATVNLCCFLLQLSGSINFRPQFQIYNKFSALLGFIMCCVVMFVINWKDAAVSLLVLFSIFFYLNYRDHKVLWGEVTNSILFHQVRKFLLRIDEEEAAHSKLWRPSVIFIVDDLSGPQLDFCNTIKKGGLYIIGIPLVGDIDTLNKSAVNFRSEWVEVIKQFGLKAFPSVACGLDVRDLYYNLALSSGLGVLKANIVVMNLPRSILRAQSNIELEESNAGDMLEAEQIEHMSNPIHQSTDDMKSATWVQIIIDQGNIQKNTIILANFHALNPHLINSDTIRPQAFKTARHLSDMCMDIVVNVNEYSWGKQKRMPENEKDAFPDLLLQMMYILDVSKAFKHLKKRLIVVEEGMPSEDVPESRNRDNLAEYMRNARIEVTEIITCTLPTNSDDPDYRTMRRNSEYWKNYKKLIQSKICERTQFLLMKLPFNANLDEADGYVSALQKFTEGLPPSALVRKGEEMAIISMDI